jgi:hypothetical protein
MVRVERRSDEATERRREGVAEGRSDRVEEWQSGRVGSCGPGRREARRRARRGRGGLYWRAMHYEAHQPVIADLEARILTIRDSL